MSATMAARPQTTLRSHRLLSRRHPLQCIELFRRRLLKRLQSRDRLWTPHVHLRQHHPKETRPRLTGVTTIPIATTRQASRHLLYRAQFRLPLHQSRRGSLNSQMMTAQMTCTRLLRPGDQWIVPRHHRLARLNSRRQCLQCHNQLLLHGRHQDNLSMCNGRL